MIAFPAGNNRCADREAGSRKEINTVADMQGLEIPHRRLRRTDHPGTRASCRRTFPAATSTPRSRKGTIEPAGPNSSGPYDDSKLGFNKGGAVLLLSGWWEGGVTLMNLIKPRQVEQLPSAYKGVVKSASALANSVRWRGTTTFESFCSQDACFRGTKLRPFSLEILESCFAAANKVTLKSAPRTPGSRKSTTAT